MSSLLCFNNGASLSSEPENARREKGNSNDFTKHRFVSMPAYGCARTVFSDQRMLKVVRLTICGGADS